MHTGQDAALYVGQSDNVLISGNRVHDNLLGIEVESSRQCDVLTDKLRTTQEHTLVAFNRVHGNNRANTANPDDLLAVLPAGIGILLVGADTTTVSLNTVKHNGFVGLGVVSLCLGFALQGQSCTGLDIEPNPDGNQIVGNVVQGNGTVPLSGGPLDAFRADLLWDGTGQGNYWQANAFATSVPPAPLLPACR